MVSILDRWRRRTYLRDLGDAARFLGVLKFFYFLAAIGVGVWLWGTAYRLPPPDLVYGFCLLVIFTHGFLATTSRPVLWATLAAAAQTLYVVRAFLARDWPYFGLFWMLLLWAGVRAAQQVERILATFPQLSTEARRLPWRMFWFVVLILGIAITLLFLAEYWWWIT